jgi:hypothetical protein
MSATALQTSGSGFLLSTAALNVSVVGPKPQAAVAFALQESGGASALVRKRSYCRTVAAGGLTKERKNYLRVVAGAPSTADVDLSLVRLPGHWLVFPAPGGAFDSPRHPDSVTKQFTKRAAKILGFNPSPRRRPHEAAFEAARFA